MVQKVQQQYQPEYQTNNTGSSDQSGWIWGGLAALALLGLAIWFMSSTSPAPTTVNSAPPAAEQIEQAPVAPAPAPAPAPQQ
jgi:LPXTG-motif cell wall-anchored protein